MAFNTKQVKADKVAGLIKSPYQSRNKDQPLPTMEDSPAYTVFKQAGLLNTRYRKNNFSELDLVKPNSTMSGALYWRYVLPCCYCCIYTYMNVPAKHVQPYTNNRGDCLFAAPGIHDICSPLGGLQVVGKPKILRGHILNGNHSITIVDQGFIGLAWDNGQPILLPPGIHEWYSETLFFDKLVELRDHVIPLGPYTLLTVDEGYAAVTQNNGEQVILEGGNVYLLDHSNWKFEKFIPLKIQTDTLDKIHATSADNIILAVSSTVNWHIVNAKTAANLAAETMTTSGAVNTRTTRQLQDISKLRQDVLMQSQASLAQFVGSVNYSDSFHVAAAIQAVAHSSLGIPADQQNLVGQHNPIFNNNNMKSSVAHANEITLTYGVEIISINIISADPIDTNLQKALSSGAVASGEALQAKTAAKGKSNATKINAEAYAEAAKVQARGEAEALLIKARAEAEAQIMRAQAAEKAAKMLEKSQVAVDLAKMGKAAAVIGKNDKFYFGQDPAYMENILFRKNRTWTD